MLDPAPTPPNTPLDADILCVKCHYNLRGLQPNKRCPECGLLIAVSLPCRRAVSIADWINIRRALLRVVIANVSMIGVVVAAAVAALFLPSGLTFIAPLTAALGLCILAFVRATGYALLASVDRGFDHAPEEWDAHVAVSQMAWARACLFPLLVALLFLSTLQSRQQFEALLLPILLIAALAYIAAGALQFGALQYLLSRLGFRSRIPSLGKSVTSYAAACVIGAVGVLAWGLGAPFAWCVYHALLGRFFWIAHTKTRDYRQAA